MSSYLHGLYWLGTDTAGSGIEYLNIPSLIQIRFKTQEKASAHKLINSHWKVIIVILNPRPLSIETFLHATLKAASTQSPASASLKLHPE